MVGCEFFYNRITGRYEDRQEELRLHSFEDYISKYRRVRGYFNAPKVGLTATPALHITDIFNNKTEINCVVLAIAVVLTMADIVYMLFDKYA